MRGSLSLDRNKCCLGFVWEWNCKLTAWINSVPRFPGLFINRHFELNIKSPRREGNKELNVKGSRIQYITHEWALVSAHSNQSIVNLLPAACCSWRGAVSRPNGEMVQLHDYVKCSYPHLRRHWSSEEVITMWRMPTCHIITCHCSNLGQGTNVGYIFKENYSDNKCSMSECI